MSIRKKFLITVCLITLCLILFFYAVIYFITTNNYNQLENELVIDSLKRVQTAFDSQIQSLGSLVNNWASWDNTSIFFTDSRAGRSTSGIIGENFFSSAKIDLVIVFNTDKTLMHGIFVNKKSMQLENIDAALIRSIAAHLDLFDQTPANNGTMGIIKFGNKHLLIAAKPIHDSSTTGSRGTLVMASILDTERIALLQKTTITSISFHPIFSGPPDAVEASRELLLSNSPYYVSALSENIIKGYTFLYDISGEAVLTLTINLNRKIHQQSHQTLFFLLLAIIFNSVVFGLVFFYFIDIIISRRLSTIILDINQIEKNTDHGMRVRESFINDELGKLAVSINHMLEANESLEEYKVKNEKLAVLATFAAGASHELATPLSAIAVAAREILYDLENDSTSEEDLYDDIFLIRKQVDRCKYILNQMAASAGEHMGEEAISFSINTLIEETTTPFGQAAINQISINNQVTDRLITMPFLSLSRVLRGILRNSLRASKPGGKIFLSCFESNTQLIFETHDRGVGMDEQTKRRAIDPFFTTKAPGDGMGLGLYLAQSLANRFGGDLHITSSPVNGTTVTLSFAKEYIYVGLR